MAEADILEVVEIDGSFYRYNAASNIYEEVGVLLQSNSNTNNDNITEPDFLKKNIWNHDQTVLLLQLFKERQTDFTNPRYKKLEIYKDITRAMSKHGHHFSPEQVNNRLNTLMTKFKSIKDHNSKSGNNPKAWEYLDMMEDCCNERPGITALAACSSIAASQISVKTTEPETSSCSSTSSCSNTSEIESKKRKVVHKPSPRVEMMKFLKEYRKDSQEREKKRLELAEKQHKETQQLLQQLLDLAKNKAIEEQ